MSWERIYKILLREAGKDVDPDCLAALVGWQERRHSIHAWRANCAKWIAWRGSLRRLWIVSHGLPGFGSACRSRDRPTGDGGLGDYLAAAFANCPPSDRVGRYALVTYMHPSSSPGPACSLEEACNITIGLSFLHVSQCSQQHRRRTLLAAAVAGGEQRLLRGGCQPDLLTGPPLGITRTSLRVLARRSKTDAPRSIRGRRRKRPQGCKNPENTRIRARILGV